jgi:hypothetical protein
MSNSDCDPSWAKTKSAAPVAIPAASGIVASMTEYRADIFI